MHIARKEGIGALEAATLSDNFSMKDVFARAGFRFSPPEDGVVTASLACKQIKMVARCVVEWANRTGIGDRTVQSCTPCS